MRRKTTIQKHALSMLLLLMGFVKVIPIRLSIACKDSQAVKAIDPSDLDVASRLTGQFDYIHLFTKREEEFDDLFPRLKAHLKPTGMLWVSWPKNRQLGTDLTLTKVIELGYNHGLVESKTISLDETWSAIKFTHPKEGKVYNNSYGKLKT